MTGTIVYKDRLSELCDQMRKKATGLNRSSMWNEYEDILSTHKMTLPVDPLDISSIKLIPEKHIIGMRNPDPSRISPKANNYIKTKAWEDGWNFIIGGKRTGAGKSFQLARILHASGCKDFYWLLPNQLIKASFDDKEYDKILNCDILVIDEFDHVSISEKSIHGKNVALEVFEHRAIKKIIPTLISANEGKEELKKRYDQYIIRRLWQGAGEYIEVME